MNEIFLKSSKDTLGLKVNNAKKKQLKSTCLSDEERQLKKVRNYYLNRNMKNEAKFTNKLIKRIRAFSIKEGVESRARDELAEKSRKKTWNRLIPKFTEDLSPKIMTDPLGKKNID